MLEQDLKKLEELAKKLESSETPLEEAMKTFSEGVELVRTCQKQIQNAELKVKEIIEKDVGLFEEKDLK